MADGFVDDKGHDPEKISGDVDRRTSIIAREGEIVNASGHRDQLTRHYGLISICGLALTIDNAWVALGGSIAVSISACEAQMRGLEEGELTASQTMVDQPVCFTSC